MADYLTPEHRSWNMSRIHSKDTAAEKSVRSILHHMGYRFRIHPEHLPGRPDIVLPRYRAIIFVHGCFWHRHEGCKRAFIPSTRREFWERKFQRNVERDKQNVLDLTALGWKVMVVWECELADKGQLASRLEGLLRM